MADDRADAEQQDTEQASAEQQDTEQPSAEQQDTDQPSSEEEQDEAKQKMREIEEGEPPKDLEDWPDDEAKFETFGGPEGTHTYQEGPEEKLGPSGVRHHEDGSVSIDGEKVDNPDEYKGDPIPGGPTDPNTQAVEGEKTEESEQGEGSGEQQEQDEQQTAG